MSSAGKQRAENTPPMKQIENALGRAVVDWLRQICVLHPFVHLVELHCDPRELWNGLGAIRLAWQMDDPQRDQVRVRTRSKQEEPMHEVVLFPRNTFDDQIGFDRKELRTVIARMRTCAKNLRRLRVAVLVQTLSSAYPPHKHPGPMHSRVLGEVLSNLGSFRAWQSNLPYRLNQIADAAELAAKAIRFRGRPLYDEALSSLVCYVHERTRRWHDKELSVLVGAVTGRDHRYNAEAHGRWRKTHRSQLSR